MTETIVQSFCRVVAARGADRALWSRGESIRWTFAELWERARRRAESLGDLEADRPLALATGNRAVFVEAFLAARLREVPVAVLDGGASSEEKARAAISLGCPVLLHADSGAGRNLGGGLHRRDLDAPPRALPPGTSLVKVTSGSTGPPAGACFDDASLLAGIRQIVEGMDIRPRDHVLLVIPISHSYGFDNGLLSLLVHGTPLVFEPSFYPGPVLRAVEDGEIDVLPLVPPLVRSLGGASWANAGPAPRRVLCAGGILRPETADAFLEASGRPVHDFYGSTETGGICFETSPGDPGARGTVGRPLPGVELSLDADGRLVVDSAANRIGWVGDAERCRDRNVTMGDTAREEPDGRVRLLGRTAHVLNIGGRKVPATRVEEALTSCPGVDEAAVVGVDDPVRGDRSVGFLVARNWPVDLSGVPGHLVPRELRRVEALPYSARGKLDRGALRELARREADC